MKSRGTFLIVVLVSAIVQVSSTTFESFNDYEKNNSLLEYDIADVRLELSRLRRENFNLKEQNERYLTEERNCTAFCNNVEMISASLKSLMAEVKEHVSIKKSEEIKQCLADLEMARDDLTTSLNTCLNKLKTAVKLKPLKTCEEAAMGKVGVFDIEIHNMPPFPVYCDSDNWMVILRRVDGTVDFQRDWAAFREGFGEITGNSILGLEKIHQITKSQCHELKVVVKDFENKTRYDLYDQFAIDDESHAYALKTLGKHSGSASDPLKWQRGMKFTTIDRDNDLRSGSNVAILFKGAWWHSNVGLSQLTGMYLSGGVLDCRCIDWYDSKRACYSYEYAEMKIRPKQC